MERWPFRPTPPPGAVRGDPEADIREEMELYIELRTEELVAGGMSPEAARREAEARFGDRETVARRVRRETDRRQGNDGRMMMGELRQNLAYVFRTSRRNPGFTLMAALTLAVALAGNTAIFSVLDAAVLRALPFKDPDGLVFIDGYQLQDGQHAIRYASVPEFRDWRERARSIDPMVGVRANSVTLSGNGQAERVIAEVVSAGYFDLLGGQAALGRTFTEEEYATPDGYPVVVLSHALWQRTYGGDPTVVGRTLEINERTVSVVGVMPADFVAVNLDVDVWVPMGMISLLGSSQVLEARGSRFLPVIGRLRPGSDIAEAQTELDAIARDLQEEYPDVNEDRFAEVRSFRDGYLGTTGRLLWVLFGGGALLLLIASANVANLLLVRANARTRELVLRRALGADGGRVARQLLTESLVLAGVGGVAGLLLAAWGLRVMTALIPEGVLPGYAHPALSARAFGFTLVVLALAGMFAGLVPAVSSARRDLAGTLRAGARAVTGAGARTQKIFVVTQVGLALLLMVGAGLLTRSFRAQLAVDPGMETEGVYAFRVQPPRERYPDAASLRVFTDEVLRVVGEVPGVASVAASSDFPFRGGSSGAYVYRPDDPETRIRYHRHSVSPRYFENLGAELVAGRFIEAQDQADARGVAVVSQAFVRRVFPDAGSGVGQTFWTGNPDDPGNLAEIVGVVKDVRYRDLTQDMMEASNSPDVFFSLDQVPSRTLEISYRGTGDQAPPASAIRRAVQGVDATIPIYAMASLEELYRAQTATPRFAAFLMGLFSALALSLACVGIYGVLSFTVGQRGPEIALRRALGAGAGDVARSVVWDGTRLAALGLVVGGGAAFAGGRVLQSLLFDVQPTDPATFGVVSLAVMVVAVLAAAVPAWRATRKAPADALGAE
ncbi:MAG TPA: ABC transporter permease [Longimicrobiales bacterium]|nr:ABC transporter permease [Longimicrobiales bacterium]